MDFLALFWLFIIISSIQPLIRKKMLDSARIKLLELIEKKRGSRVIALIHRQETLSMLGFPLMKYIDINDSEQILRAIKLTDKDVPIDIILHTPGGLVLATEQIANALKKHHAKVTVFIPHYAMSGGTMIALAADEIVMDENAVLGPLDPQIGTKPAASILSILNKKPIDKIDDETLILADVSQKAINQVKNVILRLIEGKINNAEEVAEKLSSGIWTHDYPITVDEAINLGLPVSTEMPNEVYQLMALYPQTAQRRPSVEYIPLPRTKGERTSEE
ncbi:periplasmic serine protease [Melioribacter roseus P3M-2]|uniref:Periplasmic serine protease n=1 Tax=Melioribacter roseus (strain DSM 23840 / JCM 17771 / VKM B-2668 / P3M-2) TaxID=1191523 RepID=I6YT42_MELRP|nr:ATP-dependent Clp protease proteolytic subunit [Melioribacter roseus]AFN73722.1 periplasmic serine protease [Melioribacter roseus P3M-2]